MPKLQSEWGASVAAQTKLKPGPGRSMHDVRRHQRARIHSAMVEVVAEQGYSATTVRSLARRAGVSTRTFYQHHSGKEECFLRTQELIARRWAERISVSREHGDDGAKGFWLGARTLLQAWLEWPEAARFMLVEAYAGGSLTLARARHSFRAITAQCCGSEVAEDDTLRLVSEGTIAGLAGVMRSCLFHERSLESEDELLRWVASCCSALSSAPQSLTTTYQLPLPGVDSLVSSSNVEWEDGASALEGDRALLLSAVSKLAATKQTATLTPRQISKAAGLSQRKFYSTFSSLGDCLAAAVEWQAEKTINRIRQQRDSSPNQLDEASRSVALLCRRISRDVALANLCFGKMGAVSQQLSCEARVVTAISTLVPEGAGEIAVNASASAVWGVLCNEVVSRRTRRIDEVVPVLTHLLLAPTMTMSGALGIKDPMNHMAAA